MTFIIAEAGVNHNGSLEMALALVDAAADAAADAVKFQTFRAEDEISVHAPKAAYQVANTGTTESQLEMVKHLELDREAHRVLQQRCAARGIEFMSSAFDLGSIELLADLGVQRYKIPSGEITFVPYLRSIARRGRPVILSTGMATLDEVRDAMSILLDGGLRKDQITLLHCNTQYPTPPRDANLRAMVSMREQLGVAVGYSDHTLGLEISFAAVALGATVVEKHFTLDRTLPGPDHVASLEPRELRDLVAGIRNIEVSLGDGVKRPSDSERENLPIVRKSLVARRAIRAGEPFSEENLTAKRPGTGVSARSWDEVLGRAAPRAFERDELIEL